MTKRNPKQEGTDFFDCIPQTGTCPMNCNQCFFNRPGAYYVPLDKMPLVPTPEDVGDGLVRMNCGNDSNNQRELVIETAQQFKRFFFNTSVPRFDFPGPVVLTTNPREEQPAVLVDPIPDNLMFVRLRTSGTNLPLVDEAVDYYTDRQVPIAITFMAYYTEAPKVDEAEVGLPADECYCWKVRHINSYHCATPAFMRTVLSRYGDNRLVSMCGSIESGYCRDCRNCETYYIQTMKRLRGE
jgi:hypothetical protein